MARWVCPACDRHFGSKNQSHTCVPGNDLELTFAGYPVGHREICDEIIECVAEMGPLHVDSVTVGVFLKSQRTLAEVRLKQRWVSLELVLPDRVELPRIRRHVRISANRVAHFVRLHDVDELDDEVCGWLAQAYDAATD